MILMDVLEQLVPSLRYSRQVRELALRAETHARRLNGLREDAASSGPGDSLSILRTTCLLLERVHLPSEAAAPTPGGFTTASPEAMRSATAPAPVRVGDSSSAGATGPEPGAASDRTAGVVTQAPAHAAPQGATPAADGTPGTSDSAADGAPDAPTLANPPSFGVEAPKGDRERPKGDGGAPVASTSDQAGISSTAQRLIRLRDWVLLTEVGEAMTPEKLRNTISQQLGAILAREGLETLDDIGRFDPARQEILDTRETADQSQDDQVCETVRPGYIHNGEIFRPQQVVVYAYSQRAPTGG